MTAHLDINKLREIAEKETKFPGYSVDAEGNIWSTIPWRGKPKRKLAPFPNSHGYPSVKVKTDQGVKKALIHVLVCTAFHGPKPSPEFEVRHLDGNRANNRAENLVWGTRSENALDRKFHGTERAIENGRNTRFGTLRNPIRNRKALRAYSEENKP